MARIVGKAPPAKPKLHNSHAVFNFLLFTSPLEGEVGSRSETGEGYISNDHF
jgi:hypothetical protein